MWMEIIGGAASLATQAIAAANLKDKIPTLDTSEYDKYLNIANNLIQNNTMEKVSADASKLSAAQGSVAAQNAMEASQSAGASRGLAMAQANGVASQNALAGYNNNVGAVQQNNNSNITNAISNANSAMSKAQNKYKAASDAYGALAGLWSGVTDTVNATANSLTNVKNANKGINVAKGANETKD